MPPPSSHLPQLPERWQPLTDSGVYDRGVDYFLKKKVRALAPIEHGSDTEQSFTVLGTSSYHVVLDMQQPLRSHCDCPHAETVAVCKHMVAAWLFAHAKTDTGMPPAAANTPALPTPRQLEMQTNVDFLQAQTAESLRQWIGEQCDRDPQLAKQLSLWRHRTLSSPQTPAAWRKYLTQAMPQRRDLYGRELQRWADDAHHALRPLAQQLPHQPGNVRTACGVALMRLYKLWETADDSQGQLHDLHGWLHDLLVQSIAAEAPPASWLKDWMALVHADPVGRWNERGILALGGDALRQAYRLHAVAAWEQWSRSATAAPPKTRRSTYDPNAWDRDHERRQLRQRYLLAMESSLDTPGMILLMQQTAHSHGDWSETVEYCERHHHPRAALTSVQMGLHAHPDDPTLQAQLLHCYQRDGWDEEAWALAQQRLRQRPDDLGRLDTLLQCATALGQTRAAALQTEIAQVLAQKKVRLEHQALADISGPIAWLLREGDWQQALELLERSDVFCTARIQRQLALHLPPAQHPRAVRLLQNLLEREMQTASSPYLEALQLVRLSVQRLPPSEAAAWLESLRQRYLRKVKFTQGLATLAG